MDTPTELFSPALRKFHKQILRKAACAIEEQDISERSLTGVTMAIDPRRLPEAKKKIKEFSEELMQFLEGGNKTKVYQLSVQLFSLENNISKLASPENEEQKEPTSKNPKIPISTNSHQASKDSKKSMIDAITRSDGGGVKTKKNNIRHLNLKCKEEKSDSPIS